MEDVFRGLGVKIRLSEDDDFLKVRETLTRIGIASRQDKVLYQSCHILHKRGEYAIVHFKELFIFDGKKTNISENDVARRNTITKLLEEWGLVHIVDPLAIQDIVPVSQLKIIPHRDKSSWTLMTKYNIGRPA